MATEAERRAAWRQWLGVLVTVTSTTGGVTEVDAPTVIGSDSTAVKFDITGGAVVESTLASFPTDLAAGKCLASVTGVVDYFVSYLIYPPTTANVITGGASCPP